MKQRILKSLLFLVICFLSAGINAQEQKVKKAAKDYNDFSYIDARSRYLRLADKGKASNEIYKRLGDSYYFTAEYNDAVQWYEKLFSDKVTTDNNDESINSEYYFRYAQSLKSIKKYDLADEQMEKFRALKGNDSRGKKFDGTRNYLEEIETRSGHYSISPASFNSALQDFGPSFYGERIVFSSNRKSGTGNLNHNWNNQPFLDLFIVDDPKASEDPEIKKLSKDLNTSYHESTSVFNESGDVIYFTRNNYTKTEKLRRDLSGINKLKLFRSTKKDGEWSVPEELPFNSDEYSNAHPALSPDGKTLYFASDRPGTRGLSDLWKVAILDNGGFGEPENLGDVINTEGRETFPFVTSSNEIFYSSEGHSGLGGLDIFTSSLGSGAITETYNVGEPLNSSKDDFGFILNDKKGIGYFASNRDGGLGNDDIYAIKREIIEKPEPPCEQSIAGVVREANTLKIIPGATVTLNDSDNNLIGTEITDAKGRFSFLKGPCETLYNISASKSNYKPIKSSVSTGEEHNGVTNKDLLLQPIKPRLKLNVGDDLAKVLNLNPIYFDYDKAYIRPDAAHELAKVIKVMNEYPTLKIDVRSHTDSRGRDAYNLDLSRRRNTSTKTYIIQNGMISSSRITGQGYGETQPVNRCSNGVKCSDEDHQLNRRSEFIIVER